MKIGIVGSGNMGRSIGVRLARQGHEVFFGARRPEQSDKARILAGATAQSGSNDQAAAFGEIVFWTMREPDPTRVLDDPSVLDGKAVVDLNNRDYATDARSGAWFGESIAERFQANLPGAKVVKAFNLIAMESFDIAPDDLRTAGAQVFLAGNDVEAKEAVGRLAADLGFDSVDIGQGAAAFRAAEALGDVIRLIMIDGGKGGRAHLRLVDLPAPSLDSIGGRETSNYH